MKLERPGAVHLPLLVFAEPNPAEWRPGVILIGGGTPPVR